MKRIFAILALIPMLGACGQERTSTQRAGVNDVDVPVATVEKHSGLLLDNMNLNVRPGDYVQDKVRPQSGREGGTGLAAIALSRSTCSL